MNRDLLDDPDHITPPKVEKPDEAEPAKTQLPAPWLGGRVVPLPADLTLEELTRLDSTAVDAKIKAQGAGIGYAAIVAIAAGKGGTPSGTQFQAAKFLVERAGELDAQANADADIMGRMRRLPREQLQKFLDHLEAEALAEALQQKPDIIDITDRSQNPP